VATFTPVKNHHHSSIVRAVCTFALLLAVAPQLSAQPDTATVLDAYVRATLRSTRIPGLALGVVRGDHVDYVKGYGVAGPDGRPVTAQTPFVLGSTSKSFTALAIMQLVEEGVVSLDAPVTRYLPWFRTADAEASAKISVRHLLYQTSGLRTNEGRRWLSDNDQSSGALEQGVRELRRAPLRQAAGERFEYSNENYNVLGLIVQVVSGISYEDYIRTHIFSPLQMRQSAAALSDAAAIGLASGYRSWLGWPVAFEAPYPRRATPAGLLISSADDMTRYLIAHLNGGRSAKRQILSSQGVAALHAPGAPIVPGIAYGMGWAIRTAPGPTTIWHDGDESNFHSHVRLIPEKRLGVVVLMNVGGTGNEAEIGRLVEGITGILLGHPQDAPTGSLWPSLSQLGVLAPLGIAVLWAGLCRRSLKAWRINRTEPRGVDRVWRVYLPLAVELATLGIIWILVPARVQTPAATIALFAPDVFVIGIAVTAIAVGCATARGKSLFPRSRH
jgi:CubicO group peptidase (beta-lactamase class C family)